MKFESLREADKKRSSEWNGGILSLSFRGLEMAGEAGEACNEIKKLERERLGLVGSRTTLDKVAEELADVIISTDLIAMELGIDLGEAVKNKFNKTSENYGLKTRIE